MTAAILFGTERMVCFGAAHLAMTSLTRHHKATCHCEAVGRGNPPRLSILDATDGERTAVRAVPVAPRVPRKVRHRSKHF
ncbi:MAG: hypothetical protein WCR04_02065 [Fibrobacteraceae bacterium]